MNSRTWPRVLLFALSAGNLLAQAVPASKPDEPKVVLSPFLIKEDREDGNYLAKESITATGFVADLATTPLTINVIKSDYLKDNQILGLMEAADRQASTLSSERTPSLVSIRGFQVPFLRNGLPFYIRANNNVSPDDVERLELVKGPNSVFLGQMAPGGLINWITKKPIFTGERTELSATYGSFDYWHAMLDYNKPLSDTLAIRIIGSSHDSKSWKDYNYDRDSLGYASIEWRPNRNVSWNVNAEIDRSNVNLEFITARTNNVYWRTTDGSIDILTWQAQQVAAGNLKSTDPLFNEVVNKSFFPDGAKGTQQGPDQFSTKNSKIYDSELLIQANEWLSFRQATEVFFTDTEDLSATSGYPRPNGLFDIRGLQYEFARTKDIRFTNVANAEGDLFGLHVKSLVGYDYDRYQTGLSTIAGNSYIWDVKSGPNSYLKYGFTGINLPLAFSNLKLPLVATRSDAIYWMNQISYGDRFYLIGGLRQMWIRSDNVPGKRSKLTPQISPLIKVNDHLSVYASYSRSFLAQNLIDVFGQLAPPVTGKGSEVGIKSRFLDNKIGFNVAYHSQEETGIAQEDFFREVALNTRPIYLFGGSQESEGVEWELFYNPSKNLQFGLNGDRLWKAEITSNSSAPTQVGKRLMFSPEWQFNAYLDYKFNDDQLKGFSIGGNVNYVGETKQQQIALFNFTFPGYTEVDLYAKYECRLFNSRKTVFRLNIRNALDKRDVLGSFFTYRQPLRVFQTIEFTY